MMSPTPFFLYVSALLLSLSCSTPQAPVGVSTAPVPPPMPAAPEVVMEDIQKEDHIDVADISQPITEQNNIPTNFTQDTTILKIIKVKGSILDVDSQQVLSTGQEIKVNTELRFTDGSDFLIVLNHLKELQIVRPDTSLLSYSFAPLRSRHKARPGKILSYPAFQQYLKGRDLLILGGKMSIEVGAEEFPLDSVHFFYIQYSLGVDSTLIPKKLPSDSQFMFIIKDSLFKVDNEPIEMDSAFQFSLHYYNTVEGKSLLINPFNPIFPDEEPLKEEVSILLEYLGKFTPREEKVDMIGGFLFEIYGVPDEDNLSTWLREEFGV